MQKHFVRTIFWVAPKLFIWQPDYQLFSGLDKPIMLFFLLINVDMPTTVGILTL